MTVDLYVDELLGTVGCHSSAYIYCLRGRRFAPSSEKKIKVLLEWDLYLELS